jgi:hypothetical protein
MKSFTIRGPEISRVEICSFTHPVDISSVAVHAFYGTLNVRQRRPRQATNDSSKRIVEKPELTRLEVDSEPSPIHENCRYVRRVVRVWCQ